MFSKLSNVKVTYATAVVWLWAIWPQYGAGSDVLVRAQCWLHEHRNLFEHFPLLSVSYPRRSSRSQRLYSGSTYQKPSFKLLTQHVALQYHGLLALSKCSDVWIMFYHSLHTYGR